MTYTTYVEKTTSLMFKSEDKVKKKVIHLWEKSSIKISNLTD